jgi:hypothetical protein
MLERVTPGPRLPALLAIALLLPPAVPPDSRGLGTPFKVPELPSGRMVTADGCPSPPGGFTCGDDWPGAPQPLSLQSTSAPAITGKAFVSHRLKLVAGPHTERHDTLYLHLVINDGSNDAADNVVLMLDVDRNHAANDPGDRGVRFNRRNTGDMVDMVSGDPDAPGTASGISDVGPISCTLPTSRLCIRPAFGANTSQWIIEAKLIPEDFGGVVFAGQMAAFLIAKNASLGTSSSWSSPVMTHSDPTMWPELKLGNPVDVMLVLDLSGSMQDPGCPLGCQSKITVLKQAVQEFVDLFDEVAITADRLAVRYFKTNVTQFPASGDLVPVPSNAVAVIGDVTSSGTVASGMTAMGGGLQSAINKLTDINQQRSIVVVTDGIQNVNPMVDPATLTIKTDLGVPFASGVTCAPVTGVVACPTQLGVSPSPPISTIAIAGLPDAYTGVLANIAAQTGGTSRMTTNPDFALRQYFVETLIAGLRGNSPQLIGYRHGNLMGGAATESFTTNNGVTKVVLALAWGPDDSLAFRVERDGVDVTAAGNVRFRPSSQIFSLALPARFEGNEIPPGGEWRMRITGPVGTRYEAAAIADEPLLEYDLSVGAGDHVAGDSLLWTARLKFGNEPVTDARITASILSQRLSVGTLLAITPTPSRPDTLRIEPGATAGQQKLQLLLQDQQHWKNIQPTEGSVTFQSHGDGTYSATLLNTKIVGPYTARFQIEGERSDIGTYRRTENVSTMVRFGRAEFRRSAVRVSLVGQTPTERRWLLYVRPRDRFGNYLGPDYADRIDVSLASGTVGADKQDLVDGGYTLPLVVPAGADPVVTITVLGQPVFMDRLSKLEAPRFGLSLHAGVSFPHGTFNDSFDPGLGVTADATHRLNDRVALAALIGFHHFGGANQTGDRDIYHFSGSVEARLTTGATGFFADGGAGVYVLSPGSTDPGVHAGLGVRFEHSSRLELGGSVRVHTVFTSGSNTSFSTVQAGGRILF